MTVLVDPERKLSKISVEEIDGQPADDLDASLGEARVRGAQRATEILNRPDMLTADQFAAAIGATRETVHQKRRRREVLGLEGAKRGVRFPDWQVSANGVLLSELPRLFELFGDHPWAVYRFLRERHPELGGVTAPDALRNGRIDAVIRPASARVSGQSAPRWAPASRRS